MFPEIDMLRSKGKASSTESVETNSSGNLLEKDIPVTKKRGRPKKYVEQVELNGVKCGKCDFRGSKYAFNDHNLRKHVGLAWVEGEEVVDMSNEKLVLRLVTTAFKLTKKGVCESCGDTKRSVLGFISHIENCGKSQEERDALKVICSICGKKYMKSSLSGHVKLTHLSSQKEEKEKDVNDEDCEDAANAANATGKRKSALMAVTKFQQVLDGVEEVETDRHYFFYEKFKSKMPKLNSKLNNLWYRLKNEGKKIKCHFTGCDHVSEDVIKAKSHHFTCSFLPDEVYMCDLCDFVSVEESSMQVHMTRHRFHKRQKKAIDEDIKMDEIKAEEDGEGEGEEKSDDESEESKKKQKKETDGNNVPRRAKLTPGMLKPDAAFEIRLKQMFCKREKIEHFRGDQFYFSGFNMTLEMERSEKIGETWPELHTKAENWSEVPTTQILRCCPTLNESMCFRDSKRRTLQRFEGELADGIPTMFTGGSVRSMSWCKVSVRRMIEKKQRQYLSVSTTWGFDHLKDVHDRSTISRSSLIQIWDCGELENGPANEKPKFCLGIVADGGEIWEATWFPEDTFSQSSGERLSRLGLLATASEDGSVRIWSVCDPKELVNNETLPIYLTEPVVTLEKDEDIKESCHRVSVGPGGLIAGGFDNGTVAVWNLNNISSPFCKKSEKSRFLRAHLVIQAHRTAITALAFCPSSGRYLSTGGIDRYVKMWDLEVPAAPVDQYNKEYSLDNIWSKNWPLVFYNFDDIMLNYNKGTVKFIKDIFTDRHQSSFNVKDTCLSLSFSDWLNCLCGGTTGGEVKLRLMKNFLSDQKRCQSETISSLRLEKICAEMCVPEAESDIQLSYEQICQEYSLFFQDDSELNKMKSKKTGVNLEEIPIVAVNKVVLNPNFKSFTHIAEGYNNGLIRIQSLKELQLSKSLKSLLEKIQKEIF